MIEVRQVTTRREQREFIEFPIDLYKGNPFFVPPFYADERKMFRPGYVYTDCCDWICLNAYKDGKMAGRIQGIIQKAANEKNGERRARFTRFDAIDDVEVSRALFSAVEKWALDKGMDTLCGPLSFSDLEREGLLVEGFDQPQTFEEQYNAEYYQHHIEQLGFVKEIDWTESRIYAPEPSEDEEDLDKLTDFIFRRYKLHFGPSKNAKDFLRRYADGVFELIDKSYDGLYGTVPFTEGMKRLMIDNFRLVISPKYTAVILDENEKMVCFGFAIPSLASALAGTKGRYTPKVLWRLLRNIRKPKVIDLCLIGVDPEYLNRGVSAAFASAIMHMLRDTPVRYAETNLNLEDNYAIQNLWHRFNAVQAKRRRAYVKKLA
ncbi:MAG: hypothetical protein IKQ01_09810 [Bacteroidales bacterium]|jgi:GNAT superfamily N-acetyltransferase|nr:hypothetical protein [Bacteroidales bacterium]